MVMKQVLATVSSPVPGPCDWPDASVRQASAAPITRPCNATAMGSSNIRPRAPAAALSSVPAGVWHHRRSIHPRRLAGRLRAAAGGLRIFNRS